MKYIPKLQILISTKGQDGIERIASLSHPEINGVEYIVSWQNGSRELIPPSLLKRKDFTVVLEKSVGLSKNRNNALRNSTSDWVLISDDDLIYTEENIGNVLKGFESNPDCAVLAFKYESPDYPRVYPSSEFLLINPPKGYFTVSFEVGLNLKKIREEMKADVFPAFNENFGIGAFFGSGEEDIFIHNVLKAGLKGKFLPLTICSHLGPTTSIRDKTKDSFIRTQGAVISHVKPVSWPLRMIVHALRASKNDSDRIGFFHYLFQFLKGVNLAEKNRVFDFKKFMNK